MLPLYVVVVVVFVFFIIYKEYKRHSKYKGKYEELIDNKIKADSLDVEAEASLYQKENDALEKEIKQLKKESSNE